MNNEIVSIATLLLRKCTSTTLLTKARQIHALLLTSASAITLTPYAFNNIVSMYGRCGSYEDSQHVFDQIPQRNIVSYNALISAYSRSSEHASKTFWLFSRLLHENLRPNGSTFISLLQASSSLKNVVFGLRLHAHCLKFGLLNDVRVQTSQLGLYSSCGVLEFAEEVFDSMAYKDAVSWNAVIYGCMENGKMVKGLQMFGSMLLGDARPNQFTYSMVLNACGRLGDYSTGRLAHAQSIILGTCFDLPLHNALLDMYCSCGDTDTAFVVFQRIDKLDLVSWNTMVAGYSETGDGVKAMNMFVQLGRRFSAKPDEYTYAAVVFGTGCFPASYYGKPLHAQIGKAGLERSAYVSSSLISMYFSNGESESAEKIFASVVEKDMVLWTDMVARNSRIGNGEIAIEIFKQMLQESHGIDSYALSSAVSASADLANQRQGEIIHSLAVKLGYDSEITVCGSLVDMYAKVGDLQASELEFSQVVRPDLKCWNSLLGGYGHHGRAGEAFIVFDNVIKQGLEPDEVTFTSLLAACSHRGLVEEGRYFWNYMKEMGLEPGPKHYSCMITLLSRAGLLEEAENTIKESPFGGDYLELWRTLLSSCVMTGDFIKATHAAEHIFSINAEDTATNVLLAKLHAIEGRWNGVAEMRRKIRQPTSDKDPGLSWTVVMNDIHVFSSGDQSHPRNEQIRIELRRLVQHSLQAGTDEIYNIPPSNGEITHQILSSVA